MSIEVTKRKLKVVGIAGGSASGKTTVAAALARITSAPVISLDSFYTDQTNLPMEERVKQNYDLPQAFEISLITTSLSQLLLTGQVNIPVYSFVEHTRLKQQVVVHARDLVIIEGIFVLAFPELRALMDLAVFIDTPSKTRFQRRLVRDTEERGRSPESVKKQWEQSVETGYNQFCYPTKAYADLCLSGQQPPNLLVEQILAALNPR